MAVKSKLKEPELTVVTHEEYTGMSSDELNKKYSLDSYPCTHEPPHGVRLAKEGKFVRTRHFPDEGGIHVIAATRIKS